MKAMYAGSFDPFTLGHLSIAKKALKKYDELVICVGQNEAKTPLFSQQERVDFIKETFQNDPKVKVIADNRLTVDIALSEGIDVLIRGIRPNSTDLSSEKPMADTNRFLAAVRGYKLETDFIIQNNSFLQTISSSLVRTLLKMKEYAAIARLLPPTITHYVLAKELKPYFCNLFTNQEYAESRWEKIVMAYKPRPYHNLTHVAYMLNQLKIFEQHNKANCAEIYNNIFNATYKNELYLAIFLHDFVYDVTKNAIIEPLANEYASADIINKWHLSNFIQPQVVGLPIVMDLILTTGTHDPLFATPQALISDLDLSILGTADPETWAAYNQAIRKEYAIYSDTEYKNGRIHFLFDLLKRKSIFHTKFFKRTLEKQARENIIAEIRRLSQT